MKFLAVLKDSLIQTLDCKSLYVMAIISFLFILLCASISYSPMDAREAIQEMTTSFRVVARSRGFSSWVRVYEGLQIQIEDVRASGDSDDRQYAFTLTAFPLSEWRGVVRHWDAVSRGVVKDREDSVPNADVDPDPDLETKFLRAHFREEAMRDVRVRRLGDEADRRSFAVEVVPWSADAVEKVERVHFLFGVWSLPIFVPQFLLGVQVLLAQVMAGWAGLIIAIVFTASFIPNMLQKGSLDVLLARPIHRSTLLCYRYLGGLTYGIISGAVFIGGSWLALSLRSGIWNWGYLATLGTLVFFFGVLYSVGVLAAVVTRSTIMSMVAPLGVWFLGFGVNQVRSLLQGADPTSGIPGMVTKTVDFFYYILPKTTDLNQLNSYLMAKGSLGTAFEAFSEKIPEVAWARIFLSSIAFAGVMISLACVIFARRDN